MGIVSPLEILGTRAREVYCFRPSSKAGVYLLIDRGEVVYIGSSEDVDDRVLDHVCGRPTNWRSGSERKVFDRALHIELRADVMEHYEGALIRAFRPRYNLRAPVHLGNDASLLADLGLIGPHDEVAADESWRAIARSRMPPNGNLGQKRITKKDRERAQAREARARERALAKSKERVA
jgi:hypothetical protein